MEAEQITQYTINSEDVGEEIETFLNLDEIQKLTNGQDLKHQILNAIQTNKNLSPRETRNLIEETFFKMKNKLFSKILSCDEKYQYENTSEKAEHISNCKMFRFTDVTNIKIPSKDIEIQFNIFANKTDINEDPKISFINIKDLKASSHSYTCKIEFNEIPFQYTMSISRKFENQTISINLTISATVLTSEEQEDSTEYIKHISITSTNIKKQTIENNFTIINLEKKYGLDYDLSFERFAYFLMDEDIIKEYLEKLNTTKYQYQKTDLFFRFLQESYKRNSYNLSCLF